MAAGVQPLFQTAIRGYFCQCWIQLFIFVKSKKKYKKFDLLCGFHRVIGHIQQHVSVLLCDTPD
jgi:hypothetical protein